MIEHAFTLQTDQFEVSTSGPGFINPRCFGQDFALWLSGRLQKRGLSTSEPIQEDWGWALLVPFRGHRFTFSIGVMDDSIGQTPAEWRVGVSHERPLNGFCAWFRRRPDAELSELGRVLEDALRSDARMVDVEPT